MKKETIKYDVFADIAANFSPSRASLVEPEPPKLPNLILNVKDHDHAAEFKSGFKIDNKQKLHAELNRQRKKHFRFLKDFSPEFATNRITKPLSKFNWRIETVEDCSKFNDVLLGRGKWKAVNIPHYGGPLGRAVTYYRHVFNITKTMMKKGSLFICFKGVDYKAHVFVNGAYLGSHEGFFTPFEFEFTKYSKVGENTLVVKVENDAICKGNDAWGDDGNQFEGDKLYAATGLGYDEPQVGWHHCPPGMGIYQDVFVEARNKLHVSDIFVRPEIDSNCAEAWIEVFNTTKYREDISIELSVFGQNFRKAIFKNKSFSVKYAGPGVNYYKLAFDIPNARIWNLKTPWLYRVQVKVLDSNQNTCDIQSRQFGMRKFIQDENCQPKGFFYLNNKPIRLRGANTMGHLQQCVYRKDFNQLVDDILLAKICNMNFIRLTQRPVQREIYEYCDKLGLMLQTDLPLFGVLRRNQYCQAICQAEEMEKFVRSHPSNIMVSYINEPFLDAWKKEQRHLERAELENFFESADKVVRMSNPDRVIKHVDGDYDPPCKSLPDNHCYNTWYNGHGLDIGKLNKGFWQKVKPGWNYGCGEFGAEGLEDFELMNERYPISWLPKNKDPDADWNPDKIVRSQTQNFHYMWYSSGKTQREWIAKSHKFQAWAVRTMAEAFRRDDRMVTFAIHLFIDAFPSGWMKAIMDCRRVPKPAFFAYMDALNPLVVNLRTDRFSYFAGEKIDFEIWCCNDLDNATKKYDLHYQIRDSKGMIVFAQKRPSKIEICKPTFQGLLKWQIPACDKRTTYTIQTALLDNKTQKVVHDSSQIISVLPKAKKISGQKFYILGQKNNKAWNLVKQLGGVPVEWAGQSDSTIVCDSLLLAIQKQELLEKALSKNCKVVFDRY